MYLRNLIVDGTVNFNKIRMPGLKKKKKEKKNNPNPACRNIKNSTIFSLGSNNP